MANVTIKAEIDGREVSRQEVLSWERQRAEKVLAKLGASVRSGDVAALRHAHVERKLEMGHDAIEQLLRRELRIAAQVGRLGAALSRSRRRMCTIELTGREAAVEKLPAWYREAITAGNEVPLIEACPDHYISRICADGRPEIVETTGGAPTAVRMLFDEEDLATLRSKPDPSFPVEWAGVALSDTGTTVGGIRHLFRDGPDGFHVRLTVEFPATTPARLIREHRWHLACEFSNWIEAANAG